MYDFRRLVSCTVRSRDNDQPLAELERALLHIVWDEEGTRWSVSGTWPPGGQFDLLHHVVARDQPEFFLVMETEGGRPLTGNALCNYYNTDGLFKFGGQGALAASF